MKFYIKGLLYGLTIGIILIMLSYLVLIFACPRLFGTAPLPTSGICYLMNINPLRNYYPFPKCLSVWIIWLIITSLIGIIISYFIKKRTE